MVLPPVAAEPYYLLGGDRLDEVLQEADALRDAGHQVALALDYPDEKALQARASALPDCTPRYIRAGQGGKA